MDLRVILVEISMNVWEQGKSMWIISVCVLKNLDICLVSRDVRIFVEQIKVCSSPTTIESKVIITFLCRLITHTVSRFIYSWTMHTTEIFAQWWLFATDAG